MSPSERRRASYAVSILACALGACSDPPPAPTMPPEPQASQLQQAVQQPLTATDVAIDQVRKTQALTTHALDQIPPTGQPPRPAGEPEKE